MDTNSLDSYEPEHNQNGHPQNQVFQFSDSVYNLWGSLTDADLLGQDGGGWHDHGEAGYNPQDWGDGLMDNLGKNELINFVTRRVMLL